MYITIGSWRSSYSTSPKVGVTEAAHSTSTPRVSASNLGEGPCIRKYSKDGKEAAGDAETNENRLIEGNME